MVRHFEDIVFRQIYIPENNSEVDQPFIQIFGYKCGISAGKVIADAGIPVLELFCGFCDQTDAVCLAGADENVSNDNIVTHFYFGFRFFHKVQYLLRAFAQDHAFFGQCDFPAAFCSADKELFS